MPRILYKVYLLPPALLDKVKFYQETSQTALQARWTMHILLNSSFPPEIAMEFDVFSSWRIVFSDFNQNFQNLPSDTSKNTYLKSYSDSLFRYTDQYTCNLVCIHTGVEQFKLYWLSSLGYNYDGLAETFCILWKVVLEAAMENYLGCIDFHHWDMYVMHQ